MKSTVAPFSLGALAPVDEHGEPASVHGDVVVGSVGAAHQRQLEAGRNGAPIHLHPQGLLSVGLVSHEGKHHFAGFVGEGQHRFSVLA